MRWERPRGAGGHWIDVQHTQVHGATDAGTRHFAEPPGCRRRQGLTVGPQTELLIGDGQDRPVELAKLQVPLGRARPPPRRRGRLHPGEATSSGGYEHHPAQVVRSAGRGAAPARSVPPQPKLGCVVPTPSTAPQATVEPTRGPGRDRAGSATTTAHLWCQRTSPLTVLLDTLVRCAASSWPVESIPSDRGQERRTAAAETSYLFARGWGRNCATMQPA